MFCRETWDEFERSRDDSAISASEAAMASEARIINKGRQIEAPVSYSSLTCCILQIMLNHITHVCACLYIRLFAISVLIL